MKISFSFFLKKLNILFLAVFFLCISLIQAQNTTVIFSKLGDTTFKVPATCVTTITVQAWGGGGAGGNSGGGGGGGGAYSSTTLTVTPGATYSLHVGEPGSRSQGTGDGLATWFSSTTTLYAEGGKGASGATGGVGGSATNGAGTVKYSGGTGGNFSGNGGGGGGSEGSPLNNGNAGSNGNGTNGGVGGVGTGGQGNAGNGGNNNAAGVGNNFCTLCGGGGGSGSGGGNGGGGSVGRITITLPDPITASVSSPQTICPGASPLTVSATAAGAYGPPYTYLWQSSVTSSTTGFTTIGGATSSSYSSGPISSTTWLRSIVGYNTCTPDTTDAIKITVIPISGVISFTTQTICINATPTTLTVTPTVGYSIPLTYTWASSNTSSTSGFGTINGETNSTYSPGALSDPTTWYIATVSSVGCATSTASPVPVNTSNAPASCNAGGPNTIYSVNTIALSGANVSGSVTTGAWSVSVSSPAGTHALSTTAQTNDPSSVLFTPQAGFTGTVTLALTTNSNGCNVSTCYRTIKILAANLTTTLLTTAGASTWKAPLCVNTVTVEAWGGGGGGGGGGFDNYAASGGGGGGYSRSVITVTSGTVYNIQVGAGGSIGKDSKGGNGGSSWFNNSTTLVAYGGGGGGSGTTIVVGAGGTGIGTVVFKGGDGGRAYNPDGLNTSGGGGGGSAGPSSNGNNGTNAANGLSNAPGGAAVIGGGAGGNGCGQGGSLLPDCAGSPGTAPGGAGGGGNDDVNSGTGGLGGKGQVKLTYGPAVPVIINVNPVTICIGQIATVQATAEGGTVGWSWSTGATTSSIAVSPTTTTTYSVSDTFGCASTQTVSVSVNPTFTVSSTSTTICNGQAGTITASGATTYVWNTGHTTAALTQSPVTTTTYTVSGTKNGCVVKAAGTIVVNSSPPVASTSATVCLGQPATLIASGADNYTWSTGETTVSITISPTVTTTYSVTGTINGQSCPFTAKGKVTVLSNPVITVISTTVCDGTAGTITASGADNYTWSTGETTNSLTASPNTTTTYSVTGTLSGCAAAGTGTITVNPIPNVSSTSATTCSGVAATITASGATNYLWSTGETTNSITKTPPSTTTYTVTGTTNNCSKTVTGSIAIQPSLGVNFTSVTICNGQSATLTATGATDYTWSTGETINPITVSPISTTSYSVTGTTSGCSGSGTGTVTVNPLPTAALIGSTTVCQGATSPVLTFTGANGTAPYTFNYTANGVAATITSPGTSTVLPLSTASPATYTHNLVSVSDANGCSQNQTGTTVVRVNPSVFGAISGSSTVCQGTTLPVILFTGSSGNAPYTFTYNINGTPQTALVTAAGTSTISVPASTAGAGTSTYSLVGVEDSNNGGCSSITTAAAVVSINSLPTAGIAGSTTVCQGTASPLLTFTGANGTAPYTFSYTANSVAANITAPGTSTVLSLSTASATTYTHNLVSVSDANGCSQNQTGTTIVTINPLPTATITATPKICETATGTILFTAAGGTAPYTFGYRLGAGAPQTVTTSGSDATVSVTKSDVPGTYTYTLLSVSDNFGCNQSQPGTAIIVIDPLPTAVSGKSTTICQSGSYALKAGDATQTYGSPAWTENGAGSITSGANTLFPQYTAAATDAGNTVTLTMTVTSTNTCNPQTATAIYSIKVDSLPIAVSGGNTSICENTSYTLLSGEASSKNGTIAWTENGSGSISSGSTTLMPTYTTGTGDAGKAVTLTMTVTSNNTCNPTTAIATYIINVDPDASIALSSGLGSNTPSVCVNTAINPIRYTIGGGASSATVTPLPSGLTGSISGNVFTISGTPTTVTTQTVVSTYTVGTTGSCVQTSLTGTITVYPDATIALTSAGTTTAQTVCVRGTPIVPITYTLSGGAYNATVTGLPIGVTGSYNAGIFTISGTPTVVSSVTVVSTYTVHTTGSACVQKNMTGTIQLDPLPTAYAGSAPPICETDSITISDAVATDGSITWSTSNGQGVLTNTLTLNPQYKASPSDQGKNVILTMTVTSTNNCNVLPETAASTVNIPVRPTLTAVSTVTTNVCQNNLATVTFNVTSAGTSPYTFTYTQTVNNGVGTTATVPTINSSKTATISVPTGTAGKVVYSLTQVQDANCTKILPVSTHTVIVNKLPTATITQDEDICRDSTAKQLMIIGTNGARPYLFTYNINNGGSGTIQGDTTALISPSTDRTGTFVYTLTNVKDANGCEQTLSKKVTITVYENPHAIFSVSPQHTSILEPEITVTDGSTAATSWLWNFGDGSISPSSNPDKHTYGDTGTYKIKLLVSNALCKDSTYQLVKVELPFLLYIPNSFTPNDDGVNDVFLPRGDGMIKFKMTIYDRWGDMIFYSEDINKGWDGKANNGSEASVIDAYVYLIVATDLKKHDQTYRGVVHLIK